MKCLFLTFSPTSTGVENWIRKQPGEWVVQRYNCYIDRMSELVTTMEAELGAIDNECNISSFDRVVFVPPGLSAAVIPFFDELLQLVREDVVPEQINTIRGEGGSYIPCLEFPIYTPAVA